MPASGVLARGFHNPHDAALISWGHGPTFPATISWAEEVIILNSVSSARMRRNKLIRSRSTRPYQLSRDVVRPESGLISYVRALVVCI